MTPDVPRFSLEGVGRFPVQLDGLVALAEQRGLRSLLIEVLRQISDNLERNPREWGDPYMNYRGLNAVGYGKLILQHEFGSNTQFTIPSHSYGSRLLERSSNRRLREPVFFSAESTRAKRYP